MRSGNYLLVLFGYSKLVTTCYALLKTTPAGNGPCTSSILTFAHGPSITDTAFNYVFTPATLADTGLTFVTPILNAVSVLDNCGSLGETEVAQKEFSIFLNPASNGSFTITHAMPGHMTIYDCLGQPVFDAMIAPDTESITFNAVLPPGVYTVVIVEAGGERVQRLLVNQ